MLKEEKFEFLEHTADIKVRVRAKTFEGLFENAALALSEYIAKDKKIKDKIKKKRIIKNTDREKMLYLFIDELLFLLDAENFISSSVKVKIENNKLKADLAGDDTREYKGLNHVKAATYAEMYVKQTKNGEWEAQFVLDV